MRRSLMIASSLVLITGCGGSSPGIFTADSGSSSFGTGTGSGSGSDGGNTQAPGDDGGLTLNTNDDAGATNSGCSAASQLVYVLSALNDIYSFAPLTKTFTKVSTLQCQANGMTPNSMAVDREGNAWVNYFAANFLTGKATGGAIFKVDIATGACAATNITLSSDWYQLGMGFSTVSSTDTTDTLYVTATGGGSPCLGGGAGGGGKAGTSAGLASIDTDAGALKPLGAFTGDLAGQSAELTGTGDGRLFGFFVDSPVKVAQIDKTSGATSGEIAMTGVTCPQAWAFSFWGGDFYMYTSPDGKADSTVSHYTSGDGGIDTSFVADVGFVIVGAGVSTCAPTTPPAPK